jgi:Rod binding domain-containing protein
MDLPNLVKQLPIDTFKLPRPSSPRSTESQGTSPVDSAENIDRERLKKEEIAKDFESIFISHMLGEMKKGIGEWGFEKDGASEQMQDLFWTFMGQEAGRQGGIGMWKDIYRSMLQTEETSTQLLDTNL